MRSRLSLTIDEASRLMILRYIGDMEGGEINTSMMQQLAALDQPWTYDTLVDMRRFEGVVLGDEIQELGLRWSLLAQGRDKGRLIAVISDDPLVWARQSLTQAAFPFRRVAYFGTLDEGLDWINATRGDRQAVA